MSEKRIFEAANNVRHPFLVNLFACFQTKVTIVLFYCLSFIAYSSNFAHGPSLAHALFTLCHPIVFSIFCVLCMVIIISYQLFSFSTCIHATQTEICAFFLLAKYHLAIAPQLSPQQAYFGGSIAMFNAWLCYLAPSG